MKLISNSLGRLAKGQGHCRLSLILGHNVKEQGHVMEFDPRIRPGPQRALVLRAH